MSDRAADVALLTSTPDDPDSILIVPKRDGTGGTLYRAVLLDSRFTLETTSLPSIPPNSKLLVSEDSEQITRLRSSTVHVIVSTQSGAGLAASAYEDILSPLFDQFSIKASVHKTTSKTSHREYLSNLSLSSLRQTIFVILGGDTLIYDLLNITLSNPSLNPSHDLIICPVPCGTGNALAMSLGKSSIPIAISHLLLNKEINPLPLMEITIHEGGKLRIIWAAVVCSWGLHASLVADSDDPEMRRQYGSKRFGVAAERLLVPMPHVYHGLLRVDQKDVADEHTYLLISHVSHLEPTFRIAPRQSPLQSSVSVVQIGEMDEAGLMDVMKAVYDGSKHLEMERVRFFDGVKEVEFAVNEGEEKWRRICVDGEIIVIEKGGRINVKVLEGQKSKVSIL